MSGRQRNFKKKASVRDLEISEDAAPDAAEASGHEGGSQTAEIQKDKLEEIKLIQKLRKRQAGMHAEKLAVGGKQAAVDEIDEEQMPGPNTQLMGSYVKASSAHTTDEDPHMKKFIEDELAKRLGKPVGGGDAELDEAEIKRRRVERDLYAVPDDYKTTFLEADANVAGTLTGLSEVQLPVDDRLRKIEETEEAKRRVLAGRRDGRDMSNKKERRREGAQRNQFVPIFGKAQPFKREQAAENEQRRKVVVTERRAMQK